MEETILKLVSEAGSQATTLIIIWQVASLLKTIVIGVIVGYAAYWLGRGFKALDNAIC